ncbi:MarR family winged helix-turn-helix transcriptional regulator [Agrococcus casei]|uniref:Transcriptional regulator, MarR family n=1 Tax=Agrococcus casei LMG 22410 TaxID=1255656 RepID=A0A1R4F1C3_9MICO|nr:MarR family transcriptional regulator [Agrococcus casei]SJM49710.1 Transcriptional regulator, MarR family [Agrococcus casei LMG 22410]
MGDSENDRAFILKAWRAYIESSGRLVAELEHRMKTASGLDMGDFNMLLLLSEAPDERMRMGELARELAFAPGRLTYRATNLAKRGWIERKASGSDKRGIWAILTTDGRRVLRKARPLHARLVDELMIDHLDRSQAEVMLEVFTSLNNRMRGLSDEPAQKSRISG